MEIKYKKLNESAVEPYKKHDVDAGFDLTATWIKKQINILNTELI